MQRTVHLLSVDEDRWSRRDPRSHSSAKIALDSLDDPLRAPIPLKSLDIEPEFFGEFPEMGVIGVPPVVEEVVGKRPEGVLLPRGLRCGMQGRGSRVLGLDRKVPEANREVEFVQSAPDSSAVWAAEIRVDDRNRPTPAQMRG